MAKTKNTVADLTQNILPLIILKLMLEKTDEDHRMNIGEIGDLLEKRIGKPFDKKTVRKNLLELSNFLDTAGFGFTLSFDEASDRYTIDGDIQKIRKKWHIERDMTDEELQIVILSLYSLKNLSAKRTNDIVKKLTALSSDYFSSQALALEAVKQKNVRVENTLMNTTLLVKAKNERAVISFKHGKFDVRTKKFVNRGEVFKASVYYIVVDGSRIYAILHRHNGAKAAIENLRVDRMLDLRFENDEEFIPIETVDKNFSLNSHIQNGLMMFCGEYINTVFEADDSILPQVVDYFGKNVVINNENGTNTVRAKVNFKAMKLWALENLENSRVLEPEELVSDIRATIKNAQKKYAK